MRKISFDDSNSEMNGVHCRAPAYTLYRMMWMSCKLYYLCWSHFYLLQLIEDNFTIWIVMLCVLCSAVCVFYEDVLTNFRGNFLKYISLRLLCCLSFFMYNFDCASFQLLCWFSLHHFLTHEFRSYRECSFVSIISINK